MRKYALLTLCASILLTPQVSFAENLLGYVGFRADNLLALPRWQRVLDALDGQRQMALKCDQDRSACLNDGMKKWRNFIAQSQGLTKMQKIKAVNQFVNQWPYVTDRELWGRGDYWATPNEFIAYSGDCEDYVILKYVTLRELGISAEDMRITVVQDNVRNIAHAVLAVIYNENTYILDSLFTAVLEQDKMLQYTPYYAVNETSRWTYIPPLKGSKRSRARLTSN